MGFGVLEYWITVGIATPFEKSQKYWMDLSKLIDMHETIRKATAFVARCRLSVGFVLQGLGF